MSADTAFWQGRLAVAKAQLALYDDAINALVVQNLDSYTLDTGQSRQTVTKQNLGKLQEIQQSLENKVATINARLTGCNSVTMRPGW
jgi:hypothetical protein